MSLVPSVECRLDGYAAMHHVPPLTAPSSRQQLVRLAHGTGKNLHAGTWEHLIDLMLGRRAIRSAPGANCAEP